MAKYLFEQTKLTCVDLEKELGLARGDIASMTIYPEGAVEIETKLDLSSSQMQKVKAKLALYFLPKGKKL